MKSHESESESACILYYPRATKSGLSSKTQQGLACVGILVDHSSQEMILSLGFIALAKN